MGAGSRPPFRGRDSRADRATLSLVSRRTLWAIAALVAAVAAVGVTTAVAGSSGRDSPAATTQNVANGTKPAKAATRKPASKRTSTGNGVVQSPSADTNAGAYWTPERMRDVGVRDMSVPGGSPSSAPTAQAPKGAVTPKATRQKTRTQRRTQTTSKSASTAGQDGITTGQAAGNASSYWTPEQMADVTPMEKTAPGGDGSSDTSGSGPRGAYMP